MRWLAWKKWPLNVRIVLVVGGSLVLAVAATDVLSVMREGRTFRAEQEQQARVILDSLSVAGADPLHVGDAARLSALVAGLSNDPQVVQARFYDSQGRIVADGHSPQLGPSAGPDSFGQRLVGSDKLLAEWEAERLVAGQAVFVGPQRLGAVSVALSTAPLQSRLTALHLGSLAVALAAVTLGVLFALLTSGSISKPLHELMRATKRVAEGHLTQAVAVRGGGEVATLTDDFNDMMARLARTYAELQQSLVEREKKNSALQRALDQVRRGQEEQAQLAKAIQEISIPVVPVRREVLVMPLVGIIDETRAHNIITTLLGAIEEQRARVVILDVTGVPVVDSAVAEVLVRAAQAARLLGAEPVLVGISPQVAETLVTLGADLSGLVTRADLQSGLEYAVRQCASRQS